MVPISYSYAGITYVTLIKDHSIINVLVRSPLYNNFVSYIPHAKSLTFQKC